ncbi:MAG: hypothetical protein KBT68_07630 [bacterium]|nr:hypothetical protein [Candidatus Colisoma equi]
MQVKEKVIRLAGFAAMGFVLLLGQIAWGSVAYSDPFALLSRSGGHSSATLSRFLSRSRMTLESNRLPTFDSDHNIGLFIVVW